MGLKQARSWFVFPREFFVSGVTCSARAPSVVLVWRLETAAWRHRESSPPQSLTSWLRYGFGTVLDPLRWLVSLGESSGPASRSALRAFERAEFRSTRELQEGREGEARRSRVVLNSPFFGRPQRRLVQSERRYGAEPRLPGWFFAKHFHVRTELVCTPVIQTLIVFTHLYYHHIRYLIDSYNFATIHKSLNTT